jgi:acetyl esterase/lipase
VTGRAAVVDRSVIRAWGRGGEGHGLALPVVARARDRAEAAGAGTCGAAGQPPSTGGATPRCASPHLHRGVATGGVPTPEGRAVTAPVPRRQVLRRAAALGATVLTLPSVAACAADPGPARGVTGPTRLAYGPDRSTVGELTLPAGHGPVPVVVVVHGGFWRQSYGLELGRPPAVDLADAGYAVWNVEYRRVGGGGGWPATFTDVAAAVDHLAGPGQAAAGGRLDLDRVVAVGHSAGGHLAAWLAARPGLPPGAPGASPRVRLRGAVSQAGVLDLVDAAERRVGSDAVADLLGGGPAEVPDRYALASPAARVPIGVPVVCVHGTEDRNVPVRQSERFVAVARAAGDPAELVVLVGVEHFAVIDTSTGAWRACRDAVVRLLA